MTISDWLMIIAVLIAPVVAVQVQKWIEHYRNIRERKLQIFKILMATRSSRVSFRHVEALNMIDLEFSDKKFKSVKLAWKTYLDHLGDFPKDNENARPMWVDKSADKLTKLLQEMGKSLGYDFDDVDIRKGIYSPEGHAVVETENDLIRKGLLRLLYEDATLKMDVKSFPFSENEAKEQEEIRKGIKEILNGNKELPVSVKKK